ncbi:MAG: DNA/RNA non-specific endonuclease [bacterium]
MKQRGTMGRMSLILLWILFIGLVIVIVCAAVFLIPPLFSSGGTTSGPRSAPASPNTSPLSWGGPYSYAGAPEPQPVFHDPILVLTNTGYLVGYCEAKKDPVWACYRLFKVTSLQAPPRPQGFQVDTRTSARICQHDYSGSGYDRGHMAPNYAIALCYGEQAQLETFLMSNIIPQSPSLNRRVWEHLEQTEIKGYAQRYGQVWVIDGPVFGAHPRHLQCGVEIPEACYKILVEEEHGRPRVLAFIMPQSVTGIEAPSQYLVSVAEIERQTGLKFFGGLPADMRDQVETNKAMGMW